MVLSLVVSTFHTIVMQEKLQSESTFSYPLQILKKALASSTCITVLFFSLLGFPVYVREGRMGREGGSNSHSPHGQNNHFKGS